MTESESAKKLFFEALALIDSSNFQEAELRLRDALKIAPDNVALLTNLSIALIQQNKRIEARECAEKTVAINSKNIDALLILADCHAHAGADGEALAAYDRVLALDPGLAEIHNNRGIILERLRRHADALDSYDRALALQPGFSDACNNRGNVLNHLGRDGEALAAYDKALALVPDLAEAWLGRGNVLSKLKRYDEAIGSYERALALKPGLAEAWLGRGNVLCNVKRYDEALAAHDKALGLAPNLAEAWLGRGNVFHDRKRFADALAAYDRAILLDPAFTSAWVGRGDALRYLNRPAEAIAAYREALTLGGDAEAIKYNLAGLGAEPAPTAPPEHFIVNLFDAYADHFEKDLVGNLKYGMPILLAEAIRQYATSNALDIIDLGCGTGLVGERIRPLARTLTGIDLSAKMLEKARQRQIYHQLVCSDLVRFLQTQDKAFDLAVAADVFIYVGDLVPVFGAVRRALRDDGLFCFSVEAVEERDFALNSTLRYSHSSEYLHKLANQFRFKVEKLESQIVRQDAGTDVAGYLVIMRCS